MRKQEEKVEDGEDTKMYLILLSTWVHMQSLNWILTAIYHFDISEILALCSDFIITMLCNNVIMC